MHIPHTQQCKAPRYSQDGWTSFSSLTSISPAVPRHTPSTDILNHASDSTTFSQRHDMFSLHLIATRGPPKPGYANIDEAESRPLLQVSLIPIIFAFAAGCGCVVAIDLGRFLASSAVLMELLIKHGMEGLPTMVLASVAMLALYIHQSSAQSNQGLQVGQFVASLAAVGMVVTAIIWCSKF